MLSNDEFELQNSLRNTAEVMGVTSYAITNRNGKKIMIDRNSFLHPYLVIGKILELKPIIGKFREAISVLEVFVQEKASKEVICKTNDDADSLMAVFHFYSNGIPKLCQKLSLQEWRQHSDVLYWIVQQGLKFVKRCEQLTFPLKSKKSGKKTKLETEFRHEVAVFNINILMFQITILMSQDQYTQAIRPSLDLLEVTKNICIENDKNFYDAMAYAMLAIIDSRENLLSSARRKLLHAFRYETVGKLSAIRFTTGYLDTVLKCINDCIVNNDIKNALLIFQSSLYSSKNEFLEIRRRLSGQISPDPEIEKKYEEFEKVYQEFILNRFRSLEKFDEVFSASRVIYVQDREFKLCFKFRDGKTLSEFAKQKGIMELNKFIQIPLSKDFELERFLGIFNEIIGSNQPRIIKASEVVKPPSAQPNKPATPSKELSQQQIIGESQERDLYKQKKPPKIKPKSHPESSKDNENTAIKQVTVPRVIFWPRAEVQYNDSDNSCGVVSLSRELGEQQLISEGIWYGTISSSVAKYVDETHLNRLKGILDMRNFVGRHGQGVKWLKQPIVVGGFEYIVELKTCGMGERGTQRLYGRIADTADLTNEQGKIQHPKLIVFDAFSEDGHKKGIKFCR